NKIWTMNGVFVTEGTVSTLGTDCTAKIGDFNGDGKTDIFWHNATTGANTAWLMDGPAVSSEAFLPSNTPGLTASLGDFNGDGKTDIYWRDQQTSADKIWTMNGTLATETPIADTEKLTPEWYTG
ncbi:MAG: FG-GAP repeat domain-containing protein, partial [Aphanizomenon sp.]